MHKMEPQEGAWDNLPGMNEHSIEDEENWDVMDAMMDERESSPSEL